MFLKGKVKRQAKLTNYCQSISKVPLFISIDAEWGLNMRLENTFKFPWNLTLGAIKDEKIIYNIGKQIGIHCKEIGVNINFAPDVDLNTNYKNPIIGNRSFGEDKYNVYRKGLYFFKGMESEGVMSVIKHFPGHGDTDQDSHKVLPIINKTKKEIYNTELYPFKKTIDNKVSGVMVAHLKIPSLDKKYPSSLSKKIVTNILKNELKFEGLVITDALNMKAVSKNYKIGELEELSLLAGNDILLYPEFPEKSINYIYNKFLNKELNEKLLEDKVKKILRYKYRLKLSKQKEIRVKELNKKLITKKDSAISQLCYENAITILKNKKNIVPIKYLKYQKIGLLTLGDNVDTFQKYLNKYTDITTIDYRDENFIEKLNDFTTVILSIHKYDKTPWEKYTLTTQEKDLIEFISKRKKTILCLFASPYGLININQEKYTKSTIIGYQNNYFSQKTMAQMIFGALDIKGKLPVSIGTYKKNKGLKVKNIQRLSYGFPEMENMRSDTLSKIDTIMKYIIKHKYTPGGQVLVAKNGRVIYSKNFGNQTYKKESPKVDDNTIYDLASITKMASTTLMIMRLYEEGKIKLNKTISKYIHSTSLNDKKSITIEELLAHNSGLASWLPFYKRILRKKGVTSNWEADYSKIKLNNDIFLKNELEDTLKKWVYNTKIQNKRLHYSDIGFFVLGDVVKNVIGKPNFEQYLYDKLYIPLGANNICYNPLESHYIGDIAPSEDDNYFRHSIIRGYTQDVLASLLYSTPTNAGLFSNANDLAKLGQMLLQKGKYGGEVFFKSSTIKKFTKKIF